MIGDQNAENRKGSEGKAHYALAARLQRKGATREQVVAVLLEQGADPEAVEAILSKQDTLRADAARRSGWTNVIVGGTVFAGGLTATILTWELASEGGTYVIAHGAIVFGFIQLVRGLLQLSGRAAADPRGG